MNYVCGFLFRNEGKEVALIQKIRPGWQAGHWNGVGGKIEPDEAPLAAMVREFNEEAGRRTEPSDWRRFAVLSDQTESWKVVFFCAAAPTDNFFLATMADEDVRWIKVKKILRGKVKIIPNLRWLIPLALSPLCEFASVVQIPATNNGPKEDTSA